MNNKKLIQISPPIINKQQKLKFIQNPRLSPPLSLSLQSPLLSINVPFRVINNPSLSILVRDPRQANSKLIALTKLANRPSIEINPLVNPPTTVQSLFIVVNNHAFVQLRLKLIRGFPRFERILGSLESDRRERDSSD